MRYRFLFFRLLIIIPFVSLGYSQKNPEQITINPIWKAGLKKQAIVIYASFDFQEYFDIIPQVISKYPYKEILIYTPEEVSISTHINQIHLDKAQMDSVIDLKFGNHINLCRSKDLYRSYMEKMVKNLEQNKCKIIPYGNMVNLYNNAPNLSLDSIKKVTLQAIVTSIQNKDADKILIIQPEGYAQYSSYLESQLLQLNIPLTKILFTPLKEKENPGHEFLRRQNPFSNLDNVSYNKLQTRGKSQFSYFDLQSNKNIFPLTSQYYNYLLLVNKPKYLPGTNSECCKK